MRHSPQWVLIGIGSNTDARAELLHAAVEQLSALLQECRCSSIYETEPWQCPPNTPAFLNAVVFGLSSLPPDLLWCELARLERSFGRLRTAAPAWVRPLDLDLLLYGSWILRSPLLTVPHPRLHLRRFVLVPAAEIAPTVRHPLLRLSLQELLHRCDDPRCVRLYAPSPIPAAQCPSPSGS